MGIPERLVEIREKYGYTRKRLAEELKRPYATVTKYETGEREPGHTFIVEVAKKFGVTTDYILGASDSPVSTVSLSLSQEEAGHIKKYRLLDLYGKEAVDGVLDVESRRCEAARKEQMERAADALRESREQMEAGELMETEKVIRFRVPEYTIPMSAGTGQEAGQEFPQDLELTKAQPRGTSYVARVSGDSMESTYHNGDMVFVHACEEIPVGRIGVFLMDGKQWIKELGDGVLISHNPDYDPIPMRDDIRCQGLVLGVCDASYFE